MRLKHILHTCCAASTLLVLAGCGGVDDDLGDATVAQGDSASALPALEGAAPQGTEPALNTAPVQTVEVNFSSAAPPEQQLGSVVEAANLNAFKEDGDAPAPKDAVTLLQRAIEVYGERRDRTDDGDGPKWPVFSDLNQLVKYRILRALPAAPPGKKFKLDPKTRVVTLESQ
jgi:hypothetical protein